MSVFAACWRVATTFTPYVDGDVLIRRGTAASGGSWSDITGDLVSQSNDLLGPGAGKGYGVGWQVYDLAVYSGRLIALVTSQASERSIIFSSAGDGTHWSVDFMTSTTTPFMVTGLCNLGDRMVAYGRYDYHYVSVASYVPGSMGEIHQGTDNSLSRFTYAWPKAVIRSPYDPDELIIGHENDDAWCYYSLANGTFLMGDAPGGSCIFAMGVDNSNIVWSGNYVNWYYRSTSAHHFTEHMVDENGFYPEVWAMQRWRGDLWGFGCDPPGIVRRHDLPEANGFPDSPAVSWELTWSDGASLGMDIYSSGVGFIDALVQDEGMLLGYGGEPYYYTRYATGGVYLFNGTTVTDVSGGQNWLQGCHRLATGSVAPDPLRLFQRDDPIGLVRTPRLGTRTGVGNHPSSLQVNPAPRLEQTGNVYQ